MRLSTPVVFRPVFLDCPAAIPAVADMSLDDDGWRPAVCCFMCAVLPSTPTGKCSDFARSSGINIASVRQLSPSFVQSHLIAAAGKSLRKNVRRQTGAQAARAPLYEAEGRRATRPRENSVRICIQYFPAENVARLVSPIGI